MHILLVSVDLASGQATKLCAEALKKDGHSISIIAIHDDAFVRAKILENFSDDLGDIYSAAALAELEIRGNNSEAKAQNLASSGKIYGRVFKKVIKKIVPWSTDFWSAYVMHKQAKRFLDNLRPERLVYFHEYVNHPSHYILSGAQKCCIPTILIPALKPNRTLIENGVQANSSLTVDTLFKKISAVFTPKWIFKNEEGEQYFRMKIGAIFSMIMFRLYPASPWSHQAYPASKLCLEDENSVDMYLKIGHNPKTLTVTGGPFDDALRFAELLENQEPFIWVVVPPNQFAMIEDVYDPPFESYDSLVENLYNSIQCLAEAFDIRYSIHPKATSEEIDTLNSFGIFNDPAPSLQAIGQANLMICALGTSLTDWANRARTPTLVVDFYGGADSLKSQINTLESQRSATYFAYPHDFATYLNEIHSNPDALESLMIPSPNIPEDKTMPKILHQIIGSSKI